MPVPNLTEPAATGTRASTSRLGDVDRIPVRPNYPWFYVFYPDHPGNWFVAHIESGPGVPDEDVGDWWLPCLQTEPVIPGVNHHRTIKRGQRLESAYTDAHGKIRLDGGVVLDQSLGYRREVDCVDPRTQREGTFHIDVWSKPRRARRGKRLKFDFDRQRYYRWLLSLMREGVLPLPDPDILEERAEQYARRVERIEVEPELIPGKREEKMREAADYADRVSAASVLAEVAKPVTQKKSAGTRSSKKKTEVKSDEV
jgi:hypothetical protein